MTKKWPSRQLIHFSFAETVVVFRLAVKSSILCYFVAIILKVFLVNLLAALNFAKVFF